MNELQKKLTDMTVWFHNFCKAEGLKYYMVGGTMLGAIRHQGFIPWDDDIDIGMPRADYQKLETIMRGNIYMGKYVFESQNSNSEDYIYPFGKLYDTTTTMVEKHRIDIVRGVFIDVFPLDGIGNTYEESIKNCKAIFFIKNLLTARSLHIGKEMKWYLNFIGYVMSWVPDVIMQEKKLIEKINQLCSERDFNQCNFVGNIVGGYRYKEIMPRSYFGEPTLYNFEGIQLYGVELYDEYLSKLYGNWRKLPPENNRSSHNNISYVDLNKPY